MSNEQNIRDELKEIAPDFPPAQKHEAPTGYFETIETRIFEKVSDLSRPKSFSMARWWIAIAASLLILVLTSYWVFKKDTNTEKEILAEIRSEDALLYMEENLEEFEDMLPEQVIWKESDLFGLEEEEIPIEGLLDELDDTDLLQ